LCYFGVIASSQLRFHLRRQISSLPDRNGSDHDDFEKGISKQLSSVLSLPAEDMDHSWRAHVGSSHATSNGVNVGCHARPPLTNGTTTVVPHKSDFSKNGRPTEAIMIDPESRAPKPQSSAKRKREESISDAAVASAVIKQPRTSQNDDTALLHTKTIYSLSKPYSVTWFRDELGVWRARGVEVPEVKDVSIPLSSRPKRAYNRLDAAGIIHFPLEHC
jgi:hypothetical protein